LLNPCQIKGLAARQGHNLKINVRRVVLEHNQVMLEDGTVNCVNLEEIQLKFHVICARHINDVHAIMLGSEPGWRDQMKRFSEAC
jgi:hypothetical protein